MTVSATDKSMRKQQIPFQAKWFSNQAINGAIIDTVGDGDMYAFTQGNSTKLRIARPAKGDLLEARMYLNAVTPDYKFTELSVYVGDFNADGVTAATLPQDEVVRRHKILTGLNAPYFYGVQANVFIDGLNLIPLIPKRGEAGFNEDAFIIGLDLTTPIGIHSNWTVWEFKIDCTVSMAEVQL